MILKSIIIKILRKFLLQFDRGISRIRNAILLMDFKAVGPDCHIEWPFRLQGGEYITLGKGVYIAWNGWLYANDRYGDQRFTPEILIEDGTSIGGACHIVACNHIKIGKKVIIASRCYISDNLHEYQDINCSISDNKILVSSGIDIGDHSWIGENVCIFGPVTIGKHCVVGANSVLMKAIPDYSVAVGAPARVVKRYDFTTQQWRKTNKDGDFVEEVIEKEPSVISIA